MPEYAPHALRVRGPAQALDLRLPDGVEATPSPVARLADEDAVAVPPQAGFVALRGGGVGVRIVLPETTPPGRYEGTVEVGGREQPFVVEVEPRSELILSPALVEIAAQPGHSAKGRVSALNAGNLVVELPGRRHIGLFEDGGLDRGLGRAWSSDAQGLDRWGVLADELASSFAGHTTLVVLEGAGELVPGEERALEIEVHVGAEVAPGVAYFGHCRIAGTPLAVRLTVLAPSPTGKRGAR